MLITIKCTKDEKEDFIDLLDDLEFCPFSDKDVDLCNVACNESCGKCARIKYEVIDE